MAALALGCGARCDIGVAQELIPNISVAVPSCRESGTTDASSHLGSPRSPAPRVLASQINGFQLLKFLGKGTFGAVYQARREADSKIYAIKKVDTRRMTAKERAEAVNEIRVLASVAGEHVITFYEAFVADDVLYIVTEYAGNGDLLGFLKNKKRAGHLPEATVWSFFIQMLLGTKTMHENNILHRDLKAANVFLCSNTFLKLGDLGVAKVLKHDQALASTQVGTPYYVAPEVWRNKPYNSKCDVWSLGCLLYELCTFRPPFEAESMEGLARKVMKGKYEQIPSFYSQALRTTLAKLLVIEPKQRASVEELLASDEIRSRLNSITDAVSAQSDHHTSEPVNIVSTIAVPRRFNDLTKNLPPSRYDTKDVSPKGIGPGEGAPPSARGPAPAMPPGIDPTIRNAAESREPSEAGYPNKHQMQQRQKLLPPGVPGAKPLPAPDTPAQTPKLQHPQQTPQQQYYYQQQQQQAAAAKAAAQYRLPPGPQSARVPAPGDAASVRTSVLSQQHGAGPHPLHYGQPLVSPSYKPGALKLPQVPGALPPPTPSSYNRAAPPRYPGVPMTPQQQHAYGAQYPGQYPVAGAGAVPPSREIRMVYHAPNGNPNSSRASIFARGGYNPITHAQMHTGASQAYRLSNHYQQQQEYSAQRARVTPSHWY